MSDAPGTVRSIGSLDDVTWHKARLWVWFRAIHRRSDGVRRDWRRMTPDERMTLASQHLPFWISLVLVIAIGYNLSRLVIALMPMPHQAWVPPTASGAAGPQSRPGADYAVIANAHLFGIVPVADGLAAEDVAAPETTLSLELRGLVVSSDPRTSHAIIADGSGRENVYFLQSELPGGAIVVGIQANRVVLKRAGLLEALLLPRLADIAPDGSLGYAVSGGPAIGGGEPTAIPEDRPQPRAARLADIMMPRPRITGGTFRGVEVFPGERGQEFAGLGLQPGDLVTAIDGRPLAASDAAAPFQGIAESANLTLTINRRGQIRTITLANGKLVAPPLSKT